MASQPIPMEPEYIIDLIIKRRWIILIPFCLAMIVGIYLAIWLPKVYEANTLILIQPQRVPQNYVQSIVSTDTGTRIDTLSQQVLSRTNLEKLIDEFNLFQGPDHNEMFVEDKLRNLRNRISIDVDRDRRGNDAFSIAFTDKNPETVMNVANALASYFIDENLRIREAQAIGTNDFLDAELLNMKSRLEEVESQLKRYRETYMGELPEQLASNLSILQRLQQHLTENQQSLSSAKVRLAALQVEASAAREQPTTVIIGEGVQEEAASIEQTRTQLESLSSRYTDRHPDVVRLKQRIAEMEMQARADAFSERAASHGTGQAPVRTAPPISPEYRAQQVEIIQEIRRLTADVNDTKRQIAIYERRVENTPKREQELLSLRRDYQNIQTSYDSLLARKLEAEIAVNMERKQKGEQFRILDPAKMPEKPIKPNMKKLFILVIGAGLAIGGGIVFLLEFIDNSFKRPEEIEEELELPVLCSIPLVMDRKTRVLKGVEYGLFTAFGVFSLLLFAGFTALTQLGMEKTLLLVNKVVSL